LANPPNACSKRTKQISFQRGYTLAKRKEVLYLGQIFIFEECELDLGRYELRRAGRTVKLEKQPLEILVLLLERPGELFTREEIKNRLWSKDVFLDAEQGINNGIRKIRVALGDDFENPKYIETVVGRGYRFRAQIRDLGVPNAIIGRNRLQVATENEHDRATSESPVESPNSLKQEPSHGPPRRWWTPIRRRIALVIAFLVCVFAAFLMIPSNAREGLFGFASARQPLQSLVVLPLENLSGDASQDYFAAGMTDELTTNLARIRTLRVVSRTTAMRYQNTRKSIPEITRELNVDAVIEGSVARSGDEVRITTQLIDARRDVHLWAQSYQRPISNIFDVQNSIALDIAMQVRASLSADERELLRGRAPIRPNAYDDYLRGKNLLTKQHPESIKKSLEYFERAIDDDPRYARAYAALANAYTLLANFQVMLPSEAYPRAKLAATHALELEPDTPEAYHSLAEVKHHFDWDWAGAEDDYKRAIEMQPNFALSHQRYAWFLSDAGRHDDALREIRRAQELDPTSIVVQTNLGRVLYHARRYDEAIKELRKGVAMDPDRRFSHIFLGMAYDARGLCPEALSEFRIVQGLTEGQDGSGGAHAYARCNQIDDARRAMRVITGPNSDLVQDWFFIAGDFAALGEKDKAFEWLDMAVKNRDFFLTEMKGHPFMDPLRSDPRFDKLIKKIGFPE
jgi:TolB-like protein/DNA-binding winged helix-turn-helix (wHTH) protein/Tfp pilus assembly protein PilF